MQIDNKENKWFKEAFYHRCCLDNPAIRSVMHAYLNYSYLFGENSRVMSKPPGRFVKGEWFSVYHEQAIPLYCYRVDEHHIPVHTTFTWPFVHRAIFGIQD